MRHAAVGECGNFDHLGIFTMHPVHSTQAFLHFTSIEMRLVLSL